MKRILLSVGLVLASSLVASADPVAPCVSDTLSNLIALGSTGCAIGNNHFSNFSVLPVPTGASAISPDNITVNIISSPANPGFVFQINAAAAAGELLEVLIAYEVTGIPLVGSSLTITGSFVTEDGAVTAVQNLCLGGTFTAGGLFGCSGVSADQIVFDIGIDAQLSEQLGFAPISVVGVVTDIAVDGGLSGSASLVSATNQFQAAPVEVIPEPTTLLLLASGVFAMKLFRSRAGRD